MYSLIGILAVALLILILFQLAKAGEYLGLLKGEKEANDRNNQVQATLFLGTLVFGMIGIFWSAWYYSDAFLFLRTPASEHGGAVKNMYFWTLGAILPIFVLTHALLFGFAYIYKKDDSKLSFYYPENNKLELIWMAVPAVVMVFLVLEGMRNWLKIMGPVPEDRTVLVIEATAQQFKWDLRFSGLDGKLGGKSVQLMDPENGNPWGQDWDDKANYDDFFAKDSIVLPVNVPVLVKINSLDVLHSFYLPDFQVKMDAVPGIPTQFWFTPIKTTEQRRVELNQPDYNYELACAELCGKAHFNMRRELFIVEQDQYEDWVKRQEPLYKTLKASASLEGEVEESDETIAAEY